MWSFHVLKGYRKGSINFHIMKVLFKIFPILTMFKDYRFTGLPDYH